MEEEYHAEYHFEDQRPDEDIIFVSKRHPWVLAKPSIVSIIIIALLVILFFFLGFSGYTSLITVIVVIFFVFYGYYNWYLYNNYLFILTNQRIIIIEQNSLWGRKIIEAELVRIQSVTTEVKGPIQTMLNFGNIIMRTAGMEPQIILINIENPYQKQQKIIAAINKYIKNPQIENNQPVLQ